jgi:predicted nuclease of restriction endonuclease-like RecB superfamily
MKAEDEIRNLKHNIGMEHKFLNGLHTLHEDIDNLPKISEINPNITRSLLFNHGKEYFTYRESNYYFCTKESEEIITIEKAHELIQKDIEDMEAQTNIKIDNLTNQLAGYFK